VGSDHLLDFLQVYAPSPVERVPVAARGAVESSAEKRPKAGEHLIKVWTDPGAGGPAAEMVLRKVDDREPLSLYVFKTMSDPFRGKDFFLQGLFRNRQKRCHGDQLHPPEASSGWPT
jgi:elongation factor G